jgi:hypothetical protein
MHVYAFLEDITAISPVHKIQVYLSIAVQDYMYRNLLLINFHIIYCMKVNIGKDYVLYVCGYDIWVLSIVCGPYKLILAMKMLVLKLWAKDWFINI